MESAQDFIERKNAEFEKIRQKQETIPMKDIGRKGKIHFVREAWFFMPQYNNKEKVFIIERLRNDKKEGRLAHSGSWKKGEIEYRIGYYIVAKNGNQRNKWAWGQFCPLIPERDFNMLFKRAREKGVVRHGK